MDVACVYFGSLGKPVACRSGIVPFAGLPKPLGQGALRQFAIVDAAALGTAFQSPWVKVRCDPRK